MLLVLLLLYILTLLLLLLLLLVLLLLPVQVEPIDPWLQRGEAALLSELRQRAETPGSPPLLLQASATHGWADVEALLFGPPL
jgi:hypothetical protein